MAQPTAGLPGAIAARFGVSASAVRAAIREGRLPARLIPAGPAGFVYLVRFTDAANLSDEK